jgi:cytochrome c553
MKFKSLIVAAGLCLAMSSAALAAEDGAALLNAKCARCHGAEGEGKPAVKASALKGTALGADAIADMIAKGKDGAKAPHTKAVAGVTADQAKAIADFVKGLK